MKTLTIKKINQIEQDVKETSKQHFEMFPDDNEHSPLASLYDDIQENDGGTTAALYPYDLNDLKEYFQLKELKMSFSKPTDISITGYLTLTK